MRLVREGPSKGGYDHGRPVGATPGASSYTRPKDHARALWPDVHRGRIWSRSLGGKGPFMRDETDGGTESNGVSHGLGGGHAPATPELSVVVATYNRAALL